MYILTIFSFLIIMISQSFADIIYKDDFKNPENWTFVSDKVMGGVSSGQVLFQSKDDENYAHISGNVSTKNNGGFIQIRRKFNNINLQKANFINIIVKGNNQKYFLHFRTSGTILPWQYYQLGFNVQESFQTYNLPIADFKRSSFFISKKIISEKITSIGIVAFGRDHKVALNINRIEFIE